MLVEWLFSHNLTGCRFEEKPAASVLPVVRVFFDMFEPQRTFFTFPFRTILNLFEVNYQFLNNLLHCFRSVFLSFSFHLSVSTSVLERMRLAKYACKHRVLQKLSNLPSKTALRSEER